MPSDGLIPNKPSPEDLKLAVYTALKNSKWAKDAVMPKTLSDEEKACLRLEEFVVKVVHTCAEIKRLDEEQSGEQFNETAMAATIMAMFMEFTNNESKEALRFLISMVHTGYIIEALKEMP